MLLYTKRAAPKEPKKRSRAGCIQCKEKKKKCNENRPNCDRCIERGLGCEYEAVKPRKRRRTSSFAGSTFSADSNYTDQWVGRWKQEAQDEGTWPAPYSENDSNTWENGFSESGDLDSFDRRDSLDDGSQSGVVVRSRSQYPDLAMIAPSPVASPLLEFSAPLFMEFTDRRNRRALVDHFCNVLSHLIVFKEDTGNPFRQLVLPLSHASSPVMNAIFALSSAHLEFRGIQNEEKSLAFHNKALQGLAQLIEQNNPSNREEVLGAIMLLVYYEVLVQKGSSNIVAGHLKGAMTILGSGPKVSTPTSVFLERAFRFYDVITALSLGTTPTATTQPVDFPFQCPSPINRRMESPLSAVDTLLGLSTDLWPIIHRLSHLLAFKNSIAVAESSGDTEKVIALQKELESSSQAIEVALNDWSPTIATSPTSDLSDEEEDPIEQARVQGIFHNAEAYRHSALVYLYRTIRSLPRDHPQIQKHARISLMACSKVVEKGEQCYDGPMAALLWPLFVAACETVTIEDRDLATQVFFGVQRRQGMNNITNAWDVVQEYWRRVDAGDLEVNWRDVCQAKGLNIVFG